MVMGMFSRARSIQRSNTATAPVDSYADFLGRINAAKSALNEQYNQSHRRLEFLRSQLWNETNVLAVWRERSEKLQAVITSYAGGADGYRRLADLSDTVEKLYSSSRHRHETLASVCDALTKHLSEVSDRLNSLNAAGQQLEVEQRITLARQNMLQAASESHHINTTGALSAASPDGFREVRLLVAQAEALVELKKW